jgi:DNA adenine methylase
MGKPIINYIGNKYRYGKALDKLGLIPDKIDSYVEPFVGGAGFLCYLSEVRDIKKITINDKDCMLINFYTHFKKSPKKFEEVFKQNINKEVFEKYKDCLSNFKPNLHCAIAYFVVKNCSYNSLISKYKNGSIRSYMSEINVKYFNIGMKTKKFNDFSEMFKNIKMSCKDYRKIVPKNSFVFLDPPYILKHISDYYIEHSLNIEDIYNYFIELDKNGNKILLTLNYHISIVKKFNKFNQHIYSKNATHSTNSQVLKEIIITNY